MSGIAHKPCADDWLAAHTDLDRARQTGNGRFILTAWQRIRKAQALCPDEPAVMDLLEQVSAQIDGIVSDLLSWKPTRQASADLAALKLAAGLGGNGTERSEASRRKSEEAILSRRNALYLDIHAAQWGLPVQHRSRSDFERTSSNASGLSLTEVRKHWQAWCEEKKNRNDAELEERYLSSQKKQNREAAPKPATPRRTRTAAKPKYWKTSKFSGRK